MKINLLDDDSFLNNTGKSPSSYHPHTLQLIPLSYVPNLKVETAKEKPLINYLKRKKKKKKARRWARGNQSLNSLLTSSHSPLVSTSRPSMHWPTPPAAPSTSGIFRRRSTVSLPTLPYTSSTTPSHHRIPLR